MTEENIKEVEGTPVIVLRRVDVIIQDNDEEEPRIFKAEPEKSEEA